MPNFVGYVTNEKYSVGCTGQTVYVYDASGKELARFKKDIIYAYTPMFCPGQNMFVVKSKDGRLAVYSLDTMQLIKKFRFSKVDGAQDDGFCFSPDGKHFYNIERHIDSLNSCLSIYETSNFNRIKQLFLSDSKVVLKHIEYDAERDKFFVLGFMRGKLGVFEYGFVAVLENDVLSDITQISDEEYGDILAYKSMELYGFTPEAKGVWSSLPGYEWADTTDSDELEHSKLSDFMSTK